MTLIAFRLKLGAFLLDATGGPFDHVVYRNVAGFQHGIEVEGGTTGSVHSTGNAEGCTVDFA